MTTSNQNNQQQAEQARGDYPLKLNIASYPRQNRLTTFFRLFTIIPIVIVLGAITALTAGLGSAQLNIYDSVAAIIILLPFGVISIFPGLSAATALMLIFRRKYPRWWFDFHLELLRFSIRVNTYFFLISSVYPSTDKNQNVQLDIDYPEAAALNPLLPIVKWLLIIPHLIALFFVSVAVLFVTIFAWFAILFTGKYPSSLFDFVVGYIRWGARVYAYAGLYATDKYPPFSLI